MIKAKYSDKQFIVDILCRAFDQSISVNYAMKQGKKRRRRIRKLMDYSFEMCWLYGEIYYASDRKGVALLFSPEQKKTTWRSVFRDISFILSAVSLKRTIKVVKREFMLMKYYPEHLVYLWYLGVEPQSQGEGVGSKLLQEIMEMTDKRNLPIYLETSTLINLAFYKRMHFEVFEQFNLSYPLYMLKREPQRARHAFEREQARETKFAQM